ncbi:MAG: 2-amino-4-hydroxy-6-hydroxymethyldihydropteridine diphosphokinase [Treponema sp.]|nr:2-amino-4-hydroxy-6-hydroxymethyldihydropteridine diphosphokinase [Treponema sp.]
MPLCVLGIGSNKPYKEMPGEVLLGLAVDKLSGILGGIRVSPVYRSAALHVTDQPAFLNAAVSGFFPAAGLASPAGGKKAVSRAARKLLDAVMAIETAYGRDRASERRWGERSLDIDILLFGEEIINEPDLVVPHPRLAERAFALLPLLDLLPDAAAPETKRPYRKILEALPPQELRRKGYLLPEGDGVYSCYRWKALP